VFRTQSLGPTPVTLPPSVNFVPRPKPVPFTLPTATLSERREFVVSPVFLSRPSSRSSHHLSPAHQLSLSQHLLLGNEMVVALREHPRGQGGGGEGQPHDGHCRFVAGLRAFLLFLPTSYETDSLLCVPFALLPFLLSQQLTGAENGGLHITDATNACRTLLYDLHAQNWSEELCNFFEMPMNALPKVVSNSEVYGNFKKGHLLEGIPIAGLIGDQQAALVGNKCLTKGDAKQTYGSS
jgi:hypothetical protein